jgi:hypothetical protein
MSGIGLLNEKPLHAALKEWCAQPGDRFEVAVDGYVIDIVRDGLLLEIQTANFASIKRKLTELVRTHRTRLIHPIALERWIVKRDGGGVTRRRSPRRGRVEDLFWQVVSFPRLFASPNFSLEVLLIREEEVRRRGGRRSWRRQGWTTEERRLLEVVDRRLFEEVADLRALLPDTLGESFTTEDMAGAMGIKRPLAQKMAYCLHQLRAIELLGKRRHSRLYGITRSPARSRAHASNHP